MMKLEYSEPAVKEITFYSVCRKASGHDIMHECILNEFPENVERQLLQAADVNYGKHSLNFVFQTVLDKEAWLDRFQKHFDLVPR